jgi:hypothetical protein
MNDARDVGAHGHGRRVAECPDRGTRRVASMTLADNGEADGPDGPRWSRQREDPLLTNPPQRRKSDSALPDSSRRPRNVHARRAPSRRRGIASGAWRRAACRTFAEIADWDVSAGWLAAGSPYGNALPPIHALCRDGNAAARSQARRCGRPRRPRGSGAHQRCGSQPSRREGGRRQPWSARVEGPPAPQSRKEPETRHIEPRVHPTSTGRTRNVRLCARLGARNAWYVPWTCRARRCTDQERVSDSRPESGLVYVGGRLAVWAADHGTAGTTTQGSGEPPRRST